jgi:signal transduction histidine kinase
MGRAIQILRAVSLLLCGLSVMLALTQPTASHQGDIPKVVLDVLIPWAMSAVQAKWVGVCVPVLIAFMFWRCTSTEELDSPSSLAILLLAIQTMLAFFVAEELQFVVAVEAGLLLSTRMGAAWVAVQALAAWGICSLHPELMAWVIPVTRDQEQRLLGIGIFMLIAMLYNFLAYSLGLLAGMEGRQRRALALTCERLEDANRQLRAAQMTVAEAARTKERLMLARELHDAIGHQLSALSINLQIASRLSQDQARKHVLGAYQLIGVLLSDVRVLVSATREVEPRNFEAALRGIAERVPSPAIHLDIDPIATEMNPEIGHVLFRCSQEIITNAVRHAKASNIWIEVRRSEEHYRLTAWDDGRGNEVFALGNGLRGMRERITECGGVCDFRNRPGAGFEVTLTVPSDWREAA